MSTKEQLRECAEKYVVHERTVEFLTDVMEEAEKSLGGVCEIYRDEHGNAWFRVDGVDYKGSLDSDGRWVFTKKEELKSELASLIFKAVEAKETLRELLEMEQQFNGKSLLGYSGKEKYFKLKGIIERVGEYENTLNEAYERM